MIDEHLLIALSAAVPLYIMELQAQGGPVQEQYPSCSEVEQLLGAKGVARLLGAKGDVLLFGEGKKGEAAGVFNAMARGLAILAFCPGGVTFFGQHWEA